MDDIPSREELRKSKVVELRQKLSEAGLPQTGLKEELITRLIQHYEKSTNGGDESDEEMSVDGDEKGSDERTSSTSEPETPTATDPATGIPVAAVADVSVAQVVSQPTHLQQPALPVPRLEPTQFLPQSLASPPEQQPDSLAHPPAPPTLPAPPAHLPCPPAHPPGPPAHPPGPPTHPAGPPAHLPGPPAHPLGPPAHPPGPPAHLPGPPAHPPGPPAHPPGPPAHPPGPPAHPPGPPAHPPGPPAHLPGPPAHLPGPPAHLPGPPAHPPGPPAHPPGPPAHPPGPPAHPSGPPAHPPGPPAHPPGPPAHPPGPPAHLPGPPAHPPGPPAHPPGPPAHPPGPPAHPPGPPAHQLRQQVNQNGSHKAHEDWSASKPVGSHQPSLPAPTSAPKPVVQNTSNDKTGESKNNKKKKKKRRRRKHNQATPADETADEQMEQTELDVEIQYVPETIETDNPSYKQFQKIFDAFKLTDVDKEDGGTYDPAYPTSRGGDKKQAAKDESDEEEEKEAPKISKKKLRKQNRLTVAQLKQLVNRPDVVEMHDATAQDPKLLIHLKSTRNTVPVPRHWCFKRKYLQGKRGIEKPPFDLPEFIKSTGVMEMRQALEDKEDQKTLKQKTRERVRPKMGKLTIDYQKLHDAFFKWQTKPKMTIHGDMYYEGKEFETRLRQKKPGELSDELRRALGMPTGVGKQKFPPPWLIAMQRYGPPPSYPNLKIPGLNTPIPEGCSFGYFVGGWGKPPVDETGRPLYGDVFGLESHDTAAKEVEQDVDKEMWGELEPEEESSEEEEEEEESDEDGPRPEEIQAGLVTPSEGIATPSGLTSIPAGLETPEMIQLRKKKIEEAMEQGGDTPALYTVLPEKPTSVAGAMMGSAHVYDIAAAVPGSLRKTPAGSSDGVEVALDPSELDLDAATMTARYEEQLREQQGGVQKEDLSDMVAEHAARQKNKRKKVADEGKATKKLKEFKF